MKITATICSQKPYFNTKQQARPAFTARRARINYHCLEQMGTKNTKAIKALKILIKEIRKDKNFKAIVKKIGNNVELNISANQIRWNAFIIALKKPRNNELPNHSRCIHIDNSLSAVKSKKEIREITNQVIKTIGVHSAIT